MRLEFESFVHVGICSDLERSILCNCRFIIYTRGFQTYLAFFRQKLLREKITQRLEIYLF